MIEVTCEQCGAVADPSSGVRVFNASGTVFMKVDCHICLQSGMRRISGEVALAAIISGADEVDPSEMPISELEVATFVDKLDRVEPSRLFRMLPSA